MNPYQYEPMTKAAKAWADRVDVQCSAITGTRFEGTHAFGGGRCKRRATYTNGKHGNYCTQHAKEQPTVYGKATGKIRADLHPITSDN